MKIDFSKIEPEEMAISEGESKSIERTFVCDSGKIMKITIPPHSRVQEHLHKTGEDMNFIIQGKGRAVIDGEVEELEAGMCHWCPPGHSHYMENTGDEDMVIMTVVVKR